eukprot:TRINITY_DN58176_c0_g3_i3.p1 TRINITY_DN58176_c0_g3~~TRINITY_DN58176_c0_g3_i3.p1  ORF type:complete len:1140 (-),score=255.90 TRINITY_DN58176_c0_g3_i3:141-3560(-)
MSSVTPLQPPRPPPPPPPSPGAEGAASATGAATSAASTPTATSGAQGGHGTPAAPSTGAATPQQAKSTAVSPASTPKSTGATPVSGGASSPAKPATPVAKPAAPAPPNNTSGAQAAAAAVAADAGSADKAQLPMVPTLPIAALNASSRVSGTVAESASVKPPGSEPPAAQKAEAKAAPSSGPSTQQLEERRGTTEQPLEVPDSQRIYRPLPVFNAPSMHGTSDFMNQVGPNDLATQAREQAREQQARLRQEEKIKESLVENDGVSPKDGGGGSTTSQALTAGFGRTDTEVSPVTPPAEVAKANKGTVSPARTSRSPGRSGMGRFGGASPAGSRVEQTAGGEKSEESSDDQNQRVMMPAGPFRPMESSVQQPLPQVPEGVLRGFGGASPRSPRHLRDGLLRRGHSNPGGMDQDRTPKNDGGKTPPPAPPATPQAALAASVATAPQTPREMPSAQERVQEETVGQFIRRGSTAQNGPGAFPIDTRQRRPGQRDAVMYYSADGPFLTRKVPSAPSSLDVLPSIPPGKVRPPPPPQPQGRFGPLGSSEAEGGHGGGTLSPINKTGVRSPRSGRSTQAGQAPPGLPITPRGRDPPSTNGTQSGTGTPLNQGAERGTQISFQNGQNNNTSQPMSGDDRRLVEDVQMRLSAAEARIEAMVRGSDRTDNAINELRGEFQGVLVKLSREESEHSHTKAWLTQRLDMLDSKFSERYQTLQQELQLRMQPIMDRLHNDGFRQLSERSAQGVTEGHLKSVELQLLSKMDDAVVQLQKRTEESANQVRSELHRALRESQETTDMLRDVRSAMSHRMDMVEQKVHQRFLDVQNEVQLRFQPTQDKMRALEVESNQLQEVAYRLSMECNKTNRVVNQSEVRSQILEERVANLETSAATLATQGALAGLSAMPCGVGPCAGHPVHGGRLGERLRSQLAAAAATATVNGELVMGPLTARARPLSTPRHDCADVDLQATLPQTARTNCRPQSALSQANALIGKISADDLGHQKFAHIYQKLGIQGGDLLNEQLQAELRQNAELGCVAGTPSADAGIPEGLGAQEPSTTMRSLAKQEAIESARLAKNGLSQQQPADHDDGSRISPVAAGAKSLGAADGGGIAVSTLRAIQNEVKLLSSMAPPSAQHGVPPLPASHTQS